MELERPGGEADYPARSLASLIALGLRGRCPRCGRASVFKGLLTIVERCPVCGLDFGGQDTGDGPAVFVVFIVGGVVVGLALLVEVFFAPPLWVHAVLWGPLIIAGTVGGLRPLKGVTLALQYRFRAVDEATKPGGS